MRDRFRDMSEIPDLAWYLPRRDPGAGGRDGPTVLVMAPWGTSAGTP
jgi:hypothetical protein